MSDVPALAHLWGRLTEPPRASAGAIGPDDLGYDRAQRSVEPTDRSVPVRDRLLAAGAALLLEEGRANLDAALTVQRLSRRAGASRQSWHNQFPDHAYLEALAEWAGDLAFTRRDTGVFSDAIDAFVAMQPMGAAVPSGEQIIEAVFTTTDLDPRHRTALLLALIAGDDPALAEPLRARLDLHRTITVPIYARLFHHARFEVVPPHTVDSLSVAVNALTDGFILRRTIDPEHATATHYAQALVAMMSGALVSVGPHGVDPPRRGLFEADSGPDPAGGTSAITTDDIVAAALAVLAEQGTSSPTLSDVARRAGCDALVLHRRYSSLDHLVTETWTSRVVHDVRLAASTDGNPTTRIRATLKMLAHRSLEHYWLTSARLRCEHDRAERPGARTAHHDPALEPEVLEALLVQARDAGRSGNLGAIGEIDDDGLRRLATRLTAHVLLEVVMRSPLASATTDLLDEAEGIVSDVWDVALPGLRRRRAARREGATAGS